MTTVYASSTYNRMNSTICRSCTAVGASSDDFMGPLLVLHHNNWLHLQFMFLKLVSASLPRYSSLATLHCGYRVWLAAVISMRRGPGN